MAYFVKIGAIPENKGGVGSRGYHAYRRGKRIITVWGGVEVRPSRRFYWAYATHNRIIYDAILLLPPSKN
jgi:hypothetical protein